MPIYRIFSPKYLKKAFNDNRLTLVKPKLWDDPFENALMRSVLRMPDGEHASLEEFRERLYGQCWSAHAESDALWRVYSSDKGSIQVKSTVRKLFNAFWNDQSEFAELSFFIGRVEYLSEKQLVSLLTRPDGMQQWLIDPTAKGHAESLMVKRDAFAYESEVRLIYRHAASLDTAPNMYQFKIDPNALFDEVVVDPRLTPKEAERTINDVKSWGFTNDVRQSQLYLPKKFVIKFRI